MHNTTAGLGRLTGRIEQWTRDDEVPSLPLPGLTLFRLANLTAPISYNLPPSLCLVVQGRKRLYLGEGTYDYDARHLLITSVDLPVVTQILEASPEQPCLGLTFTLNPQQLAKLLLARDIVVEPPSEARLGVAVSEVTEPLLDAFVRLIDLLDQPQDIPALAPLIEQEILYRLLTGEQGPRLRQIAAVGQQGYRIARAIDWLKAHFDQPVRVEELAKRAGLSSSSFHAHFRATTAMSPLQYQKRLRLNEARRLMLTERLDVSSAAFSVGYESPSQFSREYSRQFGVSPLRDIKQLTQVAGGVV